MMRVVKPGGQVVCMEITHPQTPVFKQLFTLYFYKIVPIIGGIVAGDPGHNRLNLIYSFLSLYPCL